MPFENILNLKIRAFFFNSATDYLPYYKNFSLKMNKDATLLDVLHQIKERNPDFSFPNKNIILRINNLVTTADTKVKEIVDEMGTELQIDPASSYRSTNGLILNDDDFMKSFELLAPFATKEDREFYESLYPLHYASESSLYNKEYIGDAILILADRMIQNGSEHKEAILNAISDEFDGIRCCEYENNLFKGEDYTQTIENLKSMINLKDTATKCDKISFRKKEYELNLESLEGQNIALYLGSKGQNELEANLKEKILATGANYITFDMATKKAGQSLMDTNFELAHTKAGTMMLDALDSGADILVCAKAEDVKTFQNALVHAERIMGRDIELKIVSPKKLEAFSSVAA